MPLAPITQRQLEIMKFIRHHINVQGFPPTTKEITDHFGFASQNAVTEQLASLEARGMVGKVPNRARSLSITVQGMRAIVSAVLRSTEHEPVTHTPGRIRLRANGDANSYALVDEDGKWWMSLLVNGEQITARQEANLRRLAACWNAFEGMSTEQIEQAGKLA